MSVLLPSTAIPSALMREFEGHYRENRFDEADKAFGEFVQAAYLNTDGYLLSDAAAKGDLDKVRYLLRHHVEVDKPNSHRRPLYIAAEKGHVEVVRELLAHGADVNAENDMTALQVASRCGHKAVIDLLLQNGAQINKTVFGGSPLYLACLEGHYEACVTLVEHGAVIEDGFYSPLLAATEQGHDAIVSYLVDKKADCNCLIYKDLTPLYFASTRNKTSTAKLLCEKGARLDLRYGYRKETILMVAAQNDNEELVRFFVAQGADIDQTDAFGGRVELYAKSDRIRKYFSDRRQELREKWRQEKIASVKSFLSSVYNRITSICSNTSTRSENRQAILDVVSLSSNRRQPSVVIQKHSRAYNILKGGRSVKEITQDEAQAVIYKLAVERNRNTVETVLKVAKKLSGKDKTTLVQLVENKVLERTLLSRGLNEQHKARLERLKQVLSAA